MKHYYPSYYQRFHCIAAACPDSCCQGWDVVIDSDTEAFYHTVQGELGKRLRETIYTDPDGDRIFFISSIFGGTGFNKGALPPVPYIQSYEIDEQTDAEGKLNIRINVKAVTE